METFTAHTPGTAAGKRLKILLITGEDRQYHDYTVTAPLYKACLEADGHLVSVTTELDYFLPGKLADYDVILCNTIGRTLSREQEEGLLAAIIGAPGGPAGSPKGFVGIHAAAASFMTNEAYLRMLGGKFLTHPPLGEKHTFKIEDKAHPITKDMADFRLSDELYLMEVYPPFHTLISAGYGGFERPIAWVKPYGLGRVFYCALGHGPEQIADPVFQTIVRRAVLWACP